LAAISIPGTAVRETDNGAGSMVMMEAIRILKAIGIKPRRTIRIALWSGEEQDCSAQEVM